MSSVDMYACSYISVTGAAILEQSKIKTKAKKGISLTKFIEIYFENTYQIALHLLNYNISVH